MEPYISEKKSFLENFNFLSNERIVLYGIGRYTATLLSFDLPFQFVGLMDKEEDNWGNTVYQLPILRPDEIRDKADIVIINTSEAYWETIQKRIAGLGVPVYFRNGLPARESKRTVSGEPEYWKKTIAELEKEIQEHEIITFDFYDTLVMRKVLFSSDVFSLTEKCVRKRGYEIAFADLRKAAAAAAGETATLDDIYVCFRELAEISGEEAERIKRMELETERSLLVPRKDIFELLQRLLASDKEVFIISDMYLPAEFYYDICHEFGAGVKEGHIWVSAEKGCRKIDGGLWKLFAEETLKGKKALHIGDHTGADVEQAKLHGLDSFYVRSSLDTMQYSAISELLPGAVKTEDSAAMGLIAAKLFNSPFALNDTKGIICFEDAGLFGYVVYGYVIYSFLCWLLHISERLGTECLYFFGREGYFLREDFLYLLGKLDLKRPEAEYLQISRRAVMSASINNREEFEEVVRFPFSGTFEAYMYSRFNVRVDEGDGNREENVNASADSEKLLRWLTPYKGKIEKQITAEKASYAGYISRFDWNRKFAVVDSWYYGNTQLYFSRMLNQTTDGFYMACDLSEDNRCACTNSMYACFQTEADQRAEKSCLKKKALITESLLTAPVGMLKYIDKEAKFVYDEEKENQKHFSTKIRINAGIREFLSDMADMLPSTLTPEGNPLFADTLFGVFMDAGCEVSAEIKDSFWSDNGNVNGKEFKLFE